MVKAIEARGALDIAKRCLQMTGQVFRHALAHGSGGATRNPASVTTTSLSNNTILGAPGAGALERMGYKGRMTGGHGFREIASTILHEQGFDHAHIELQLAHQERNAVGAAYNHALYLKQRARDDAGVGRLSKGLKSENVVPLRRTAS